MDYKLKYLSYGYDINDQYLENYQIFGDGSTVMIKINKRIYEYSVHYNSDYSLLTNHFSDQEMVIQRSMLIQKYHTQWQENITNHVYKLLCISDAIYNVEYCKDIIQLLSEYVYLLILPEKHYLTTQIIKNGS